MGVEEAKILEGARGQGPPKPSGGKMHWARPSANANRPKLQYLPCCTLIAGPSTFHQGGITCGAIDEPRKSSKAIDERVIVNFRDKNVVIARFRDKNVYR